MDRIAITSDVADCLAVEWGVRKSGTTRRRWSNSENHFFLLL